MNNITHATTFGVTLDQTLEVTVERIGSTMIVAEPISGWADWCECVPCPPTPVSARWATGHPVERVAVHGPRIIASGFGCVLVRVPRETGRDRYYRVPAPRGA